MQRLFALLVSALLIASTAIAADLQVRQDTDTGTISVFRVGDDEPILTQNARPDFRPYIHPIVAPDGQGVLTQANPAYNPHQTGLYWGFTQVNGRDYFHHPEETHWRRVSAMVMKPASSRTDLNVRWQTIYDLLDADGAAVLRETQTWTMREQNGKYILELDWRGTALRHVTIGEFDYGGMFLRMPWRPGSNAKAVNSIRQEDARAEGQRAVWLDVGIQLDGRDDMAHIAIFDHPNNEGYPQPWRVDGEFGVGPVAARLGDWMIAEGETAVIQHQLLVYTGEMNDVTVTNAWGEYTHNRDGIPSSQWGLARKEGYEAEFLTPEKAVEAMTIGDDFEVNVFAAEPMITQPMAFCWDDKGRLWIAENRDYLGRGNGVEYSGESRVSILEDTDRDGVADTKKIFMDRVVSPSAMAVGLDGLWLGAIPNLLFVPDRDDDDKADEDDIEIRLTGWGKRDMHEIINSLHWGPDGWLYGLQGLFTPSRVGKPAGKSAVYAPDTPYPSAPRSGRRAQRGRNVASIAGKTLATDFKGGVVTWVFSKNGKARISGGWAEDGIDGTFTQKGKSVYLVTEGFKLELTYDGETIAFKEDEGLSTGLFEYDGEPTDINGGVWRYHPTKDRFEVVAHGFSNPWGIDFDAKGQIFISACVIPHLWYVIPGGLYHRQAGSHFNPNAYSDIRTIGDHRHRSAHGGARVYLSDAFPEKYKGQLFMANIHEHAVLTDVLKRKGSGYVGHHGEDFMHANNAQFVGFSTEIGPAGAVYTLDWHDADICGGEVQTMDTGRVYRIQAKNPGTKNWEGRYDDLRTFSDAKLVDLQLSESAWHARRARVILQNRTIKGDIEDSTHAALTEMFKTNSNGDHRLRALWALHVTGGIKAAGLEKALHDNDEFIRAWAIQLLCEDMAPSATARIQFVEMAESDPSPVVRLYLASALQRMNKRHRWTIAGNLIEHSEDAEDHNIPKILWYGIEPMIADNPDKAIDLANQSKIPLITRYIARRLTVADQLTKLVDEIGSDTKMRQLMLLGMRDGLEGRNDLGAPQNWARVYEELRANDDEAAAIALQLSLEFGDAVAALALLETIQNDGSSLDDRQQALRGLAARKRAELKPLLVALLDDDALRSEAIRAMASYDDVSLAETLLEWYPNLSTEDKLEAVHVMASRPESGTLLTTAIADGDVPRRDVPTYIARLMLRVVGNRFIEVWGPVEGLSPDSEAAFVRYQTLLTDEALAKADARRGREVFNTTCFACHQLYGEGGLIGPDLTGANRTDITYLLGNILTPSEIIQEEYKMSLVFTEDGQVYSGVVAGEDSRQLQLLIANVEEPVTIPKSQIIDRELTDLSMMPEGLLENLTDPEVLDLVAYLRTLEPVLMQEAANR